MSRDDFEWREWSDGSDPWQGLLPVDEPNNYSLRRIASIYRRGDGWHVGAYHYPQSTGHKVGGSVVQKTARGCQRWIERELGGFWEPPTIRNAITYATEPTDQGNQFVMPGCEKDRSRGPEQGDLF